VTSTPAACAAIASDAGPQWNCACAKKGTCVSSAAPRSVAGGAVRSARDCGASSAAQPPSSVPASSAAASRGARRRPRETTPGFSGSSA